MEDQNDTPYYRWLAKQDADAVELEAQGDAIYRRMEGIDPGRPTVTRREALRRSLQVWREMREEAKAVLDSSTPLTEQQTANLTDVVEKASERVAHHQRSIDTGAGDWLDELVF